MVLFSSRFTRLPTELLLIILDFLCEPNLSPLRCEEEERSPTSYSIRHIRSLSLVSRGLRQLCLPLLFSSLKFLNAQQQQLRAFEAKCAEDAQFARLIRKLNLADVRSPDVLPSLLSSLQSLEWLDLRARNVDANLLTTVNSHPTLKTVAVSDAHLSILPCLIPFTSLALSKILINSTIFESSLTLRSSAKHSLMSRSVRLARLTLQGETDIIAGPGGLLIPSLEFLDIEVSPRRNSPMTWLSGFVDQHESLKTIKFSGDPYGSSWRRNPDIAFPLQFFDAVEREGLGRSVALNAFSISRIGPTSSLDDWQVAELEMTVDKAVGIPGLRIASSLAPQLCSLVFRMPRLYRRPTPIDDLVAGLSCFPSLHRLELRGIYQHLLFKGQAPWALPPSKPGRKVSNCIVADAALRWISARAAQRVSTLGLIHLTDDGDDGNGRLRHPWRLYATYQVQRNPPSRLEFYGEPLFVMADRFCF
ncbi:hypothetical protein FB451DRAFT_1270207 [Mycena latifolia]|nr:hypothetical protein FB451DRAFT_1270207 [Mycena latifolia]